MFVVKKLREDEELFAQKLVGKIDSRVNNARAVRADWIWDVADADSVEVFTATWFFDEKLIVQIVAVSVTKKVNFSIFVI